MPGSETKDLTLLADGISFIFVRVSLVPNPMVQYSHGTRELHEAQCIYHTAEEFHIRLPLT